jgi:hypothetical protein
MLRKRSAFGNLPLSQNVPSMARVAAGAFGFLIFSHAPLMAQTYTARLLRPRASGGSAHAFGTEY